MSRGRLAAAPDPSWKSGIAWLSRENRNFAAARNATALVNDVVDHLW
jgi:hypothetical protein